MSELDLDAGVMFVDRMQSLIEAEQLDDVLGELFDKFNQPLVTRTAMELLTLFGARLQLQGSTVSRDHRECLESAVEFVVKVGKPKEVLLSLLELLESSAPSSQHQDTPPNLPLFQLITRQLKIVLLKFPQKQDGINRLTWAFEALIQHLRGLPLPPDYQFEDSREALLLENSPELPSLEGHLSAVLDFCQPLVAQVTQCSLAKDQHQARSGNRILLTKFLISILANPIGKISCTYCSLEIRDSPEILRLLSSCINSIYTLNRGGILAILQLYADLQKEEDAGVLAICKLGGGTLAYWVFAKQICLDKEPCIRSPDWLLQQLTPFLIGLVVDGGSVSRDMGLELAECLSNSICPESLMGATLDIPEFQNLYRTLAFLASSFPQLVKHNRAVNLFRKMIGCLRPRGQILAIKFLFHTTEPSSEEASVQSVAINRPFEIRGFLIDYYRSKLTNNSPANVEFWTALEELLSIFGKLEQGETSDVLEMFSQLMASLNLIRYLGLLHKNGQWFLKADSKEWIIEQFLNPLRKAIELSKAHYELELKNLRENAGEFEQGEFESRQDLLNSSLIRFEMIASVLAIVRQLIDR